MPVNSTRNHQRFSTGATTSASGFGPLSTTSFLFDDADEKSLSLDGLDLDSSVARSLAQLEGDDSFPILIKDGQRVSLLCTSFKVYLTRLSYPPTLLRSIWHNQRPLTLKLGQVAFDIDQLTKACLIRIQACIVQYSTT